MRRAAGFVLASGDAGRRMFLLLRNARHATWCFPKGHLLDDEGLEEGARRELEEETGITRITVLPGFHRVSRYRVPPGRKKDASSYEKEVHYFLATTPSQEWQRSPEHDDGGWYDAEAAISLLQHPELKETLREACRVLLEPCPS